MLCSVEYKIQQQKILLIVYLLSWQKKQFKLNNIVEQKMKNNKKKNCDVINGFGVLLTCPLNNDVCASKQLIQFISKSNYTFFDYGNFFFLLLNLINLRCTQIICEDIKHGYSIYYYVESFYFTKRVTLLISV